MGLGFRGFPKLGVPSEGLNRVYVGVIIRLYRDTKLRGTFLGHPLNEGFGILGSVLGSPYLGKLSDAR